MTAQVIPFPPLAQIRDLADLGYSTSQIARLTGRTVTYVRQVLTDPRPARWVSAS